MRFILCLLVSLALPVQAKQVVMESPGGAAEADIAAARDAFRAGDATRLERIAQRLKTSPLEVYATYYRLSLGLEQAAPEKVREFLSRPEDTPLIDQLRGEWLKMLGKQQQWDLFDAEYPRLLNEDAELTCYALQSRHRTGDAAALHEARMLWFSGKALPDSCNPLFDAALESGVIGEQDVWQRLRLMLEAGSVSLARQYAARLSGEHAVPAAALGSAANDPARYLDKLSLNNVSKGQRLVALFALQRLARQSPDQAIARWNALSHHFTEDEQHYFLGRLAYEAARQQDGRAVQWFKAAAGAPLDEQQAAWRARAALRAQDWLELLAAIDNMGERQRDEPAWRYWKAHALRAQGKTAESNKLLAPLSHEFHFYGQLALEDLSASPLLGNAPPAWKPGMREINGMLALPGVQRTLALYRADLRKEALNEWRWTLRNFNDRELLTAAEIARRNGMYDRAIGAADMTVNQHDFSLRYLAPYRDQLQPHIRENGLEEAWVYGLMRQESRFASSAKSVVGASGLMQVMPSTAKWIARQLGLKDYRRALLHDIDTNLKLGTYYMKTVLSWFDGNPVLASAAYNAGPGRARKWRGETPLEGAIYAETIPFDETRDYVKKVMSNTVHYARQFDAPPLPLKQRLGVIAPKTPENQRPIPDEK